MQRVQPQHVEGLRAQDPAEGRAGRPSMQSLARAPLWPIVALRLLGLWPPRFCARPGMKEPARATGAPAVVQGALGRCTFCLWNGLPVEFICQW